MVEVPGSCISANGARDLVNINGVLNTVTVKDSETKRTAKVIRDYLHCKDEPEVLEVIAWPPQNHDLNIMCVWDYVKRQKDL